MLTSAVLTCVRVASGLQHRPAYLLLGLLRCSALGHVEKWKFADRIGWACMADGAARPFFIFIFKKYKISKIYVE